MPVSAITQQYYILPDHKIYVFLQRLITGSIAVKVFVTPTTRALLVR